MVEHLKGVDLVLHAAGPFSKTSRQMLNACLESNTHYLDITGEISVFEQAFSMRQQFAKAKLTAIPGVGFDVVPTDCLAAMLKADLPDANKLSMAFFNSGKTSAGTAKSSIEGIKAGIFRRKAGVIVLETMGAINREIRIFGKSYHSTLIPWGDVSTAFYSTGIPNIEFYIPMKKADIVGARLFKCLLSLPGAESFFKEVAGALVKGPSESERKGTTVLVWGEVENPDGERKTHTLTVPEGYDLTVMTALRAIETVLSGTIQPGVLTPSMAFGKNFILNIDGVKLN